MAYEIIGWKNKGETGAKPINRDNLRHMDNGILNLDTYKAEITPLLTVSDTAPVECERGDLYYNTTTELIYVATQPDTWSEEGTTPSIFNLYVDLSSSKLYYYDGTNFNSYGSGGGGETLPVGTELDFDGTSQDIPTGWEETTNTTQVLWTNSNSSSSFAEQTITLSSNDYDFYEIYCTYNGSTASQYVNGFKTIKGKGLIISEHGYGTDLSIRRKVDYTDATHLYISGAYGGANIDNGYLIPIYVIGYKTGIFN